MTATAEHVLEEIRTLPPPEMRAVWEQLTQMVNNIGSASAPPAEAPTLDPAKAQEALDALDGKFTGSRMLQLLLEDRAQDRLREEAQLEIYLASRRSSGHALS